MTFRELNIIEPILKAVSEKGYNQSTPIQEKAIPLALRKQDILGIAQTGTGKTAAFAIPIIQHLYLQSQTNKKPNPRKEVKALILTSTRELALQIDNCFADYSKYTNLQHCAIYGGVKQKLQTEKLKRGIDILVATPGRLLDLIDQGFINLDFISYFVLDEADRMLDMGFVHDIKRLLPRLPKNRQTSFFSATMPKTIVELSKTILTKPVRVEVTPVASTVDSIEQFIHFVEKTQKRDLLVTLLNKDVNKSTLVFSRTKRGADRIAYILSKAGIKSEAIHGNKSQEARQRTLTRFKSGKIRVMIATDIAARGIDINQLEIVINYDMPDVAETYVHRIGRTGRAGNSGIAHTFCSEEEYIMVKDIQKLTGRKLNTVSLSA